jgi:hypothetical protein
MKKEKILEFACQIMAGIMSNPSITIFQAAEHRRRLLLNVVDEVQEAVTRLGVKMEDE